MKFCRIYLQSNIAFFSFLFMKFAFLLQNFSFYLLGRFYKQLGFSVEHAPEEIVIEHGIFEMGNYLCSQEEYI